MCNFYKGILGPRMNLRFQVREDRSLNLKNHEILNKYLFSINKLSTKTMTQNHYFVIHYNTIIYYQRHKTLLFLTILEHFHDQLMQNFLSILA